MRFLRVKILAFRNIPELDLDLSETDGSPLPVAVLVGPNGSGKTAVLDALVRLSFPLAFHEAREGGSRPVEADLRPGDSPAKLWAAVTPAPWERETLTSTSPAIGCSIERDGRKSHLRAELPHGLHPIGEPVHPPILYMDAIRYVRRGRVKAVTAVGSLAEGATQAAVGSARHRWTKQQLVNLKWAEYRERDTTGSSDLFSRVWAPVHRVLERIRFREIDDDLAILFDTPSGVVDFDDLSSGEKSVILMMTEIQLRRMEQAAILIDEIELHLHPLWQAKILDALRELAPTCQFIVTTQSPIVVESVKEAKYVFTLGDL